MLGSYYYFLLELSHMFRNLHGIYLLLYFQYHYKKILQGFVRDKKFEDNYNKICILNQRVFQDRSNMFQYRFYKQQYDKLIYLKELLNRF